MIAFKGKVIYKDDLPRNEEEPITFKEMIDRLNKNDTFEFVFEEGTNETVLTIIRKK